MFPEVCPGPPLPQTCRGCLSSMHIFRISFEPGAGSGTSFEVPKSVKYKEYFRDL